MAEPCKAKKRSGIQMTFAGLRLRQVERHTLAMRKLAVAEDLALRTLDKEQDNADTSE